MPFAQPEYRVIYHEVAKKQVRECTVALLAAGWKMGTLVETLAKAERRLKADPNDCGEPMYNLPPLGFVVVVFCVRPFRIHFAIHEKTRTVFIRDVAVLDPKLI